MSQQGKNWPKVVFGNGFTPLPYHIAFSPTTPQQILMVDFRWKSSLFVPTFMLIICFNDVKPIINHIHLLRAQNIIPFLEEKNMSWISIGDGFLQLSQNMIPLLFHYYWFCSAMIIWEWALPHSQDGVGLLVEILWNARCLRTWRTSMRPFWLVEAP